MTEYKNCISTISLGTVDHYISNIPSPYGSAIELFHNVDTNEYVRCYPASGSLYSYIDEEEAKEIIMRSRPPERLVMFPRPIKS